MKLQQVIKFLNSRRIIIESKTSDIASEKIVNANRSQSDNHMIITDTQIICSGTVFKMLAKNFHEVRALGLTGNEFERYLVSKLDGQKTV